MRVVTPVLCCFLLMSCRARVPLSAGAPLALPAEEMSSVLLKRPDRDRELVAALRLLTENGIQVVLDNVGGSVRSSERESALRLLRARTDLLPVVDEEGRSIVASAQVHDQSVSRVVDLLKGAGIDPRVVWDDGGFMVDVDDREYTHAISVLSRFQNLGGFLQPRDSRKDRGYVNAIGGNWPHWHTREGSEELLGAQVLGTASPPPYEYLGIMELLDQVWSGRRDLLTSEERQNWADYLEREVIPRITGPDAPTIKLRRLYVVARIGYLRGDTEAPPGRFADWRRRHGRPDPK